MVEYIGGVEPPLDESEYDQGKRHGIDQGRREALEEQARWEDEQARVLSKEHRDFEASRHRISAAECRRRAEGAIVPDDGEDDG